MGATDVVLTTSAVTFSSLEQKYGGFLAPSFKILVDGTDCVQTGMAIEGVTVNTEINSVDSCSFAVNNAYDPVARTFSWESTLKIGNPVEVKLGYVDKYVSVFYGIITSVTYDYPESGIPRLSIEGRSLATLMQYGNAQLLWDQKTPAEIVQAIAGEYGLTANVTVDASEPISIPQREPDFNFLLKLANRFNCVMFVVGKTLYFQKFDLTSTAIVTLTWGQNLIRFKPTFDIGSQVQKFTVIGRDNYAKTALTASSTPDSSTGSYASTVSSVMSAVSTKTKESVIVTSLSKQEDVQALADALFNKQAFDYLSGDGECVGIPELRAGMFIGLEYVSDLITGPVYLKSVTHTLNGSGYMTDFTIGGTKSMVESLVSAKEKPDAVPGTKEGTVTGDVGRAPGVMVGIVTDNKDPDKKARVKLQFPVYNDGRETDWVPIATMMGGNGRGAVFIPEINDEVLVAFEQGDASKPYVIGGLWNQNDVPPTADYEKNNLRLIQSRAGHQLVFDDTDSKGKITIKTTKGHIIEFTDESDTINIADSSGNNSVKIVGGSTNELTVATSGGTIKLNAQGEVSVTANQAIKMSAPQISLEASGTMDLKANGSLNIQSTGQLAIKGTMVQIN